MKSSKKILLSLIFLIIFFVLLEIPFRVYDYGFKYRKIKEEFSQYKTDFLFEEVMTYLFKTGCVVRDPHLIWRHKYSKEYPLNSIGLRTYNRKEISYAKDNDQYRIIILGGSHPFGLGLKYEDTYAYQLESLFRDNQAKWNKRIEVINASVPGYSTLQVLNFLRYHMINYKPDLVIIDAGNNDGIPLSSDWPWRDSEVMKSTNEFQSKITSLLERSSFFWYFREFIYKIKNFLSKNNKVGNPEFTRATKEENKQNLEAIKDLAYSNNSKVVFLSQVFMFGGFYLVRGFGSVEDPYLDIYPSLKEKGDIADYFIDSIHGSAKGHKEIAKLVYDYLEMDIMKNELRKQ